MVQPALHHRDRGRPRAACGLLAAGCLVIGALAGCSDPEPGLTAEQFYSRAAATQARSLPAGPNGWDGLVEVLSEHDSISQEAAAPFAAEANPDTWPTMQVDAICFGTIPRAGLENGLSLIATMETAGLFDRLSKALETPRIVQPWDTSRSVYGNLSVGFGHAARCRALIKTLRARARLAASSGDGVVLADTLRQQLALARAMANRGLSIDYLMGVAGVTLALRDMRLLVLEETLNAGVIRGMLATIDSGPLLPPAAAVVDTERNFALATFVESAQESGFSVKRSKWISRIESAHAAAVASLADPGRGRAAELGDDEFFGSVLDGISDTDESLRLLDHSFAMVLDGERRLRFDTAATRVVLLAALFRAEHGRYPDSINEIDAPEDPIARRAFVLRPTPNDELPLLLYSVGVDGEDNGGREREAGALSLPSPDDFGFDCRCTSARRPYVGFTETMNRSAPSDE